MTEIVNKVTVFLFHRDGHGGFACQLREGGLALFIRHQKLTGIPIG